MKGIEIETGEAEGTQGKIWCAFFGIITLDLIHRNFGKNDTMYAAFNNLSLP